ncbi:hypothetical protein G3I39_25130 [Streptomyces fulvissimus]|uniref:Uncharacterized protein n=1 Tax=Streptomyces microflavus TaxID=1919 RepID=A0A6N9VC70_STRMI|nr:hypothetical protein [Streptomyces microflavus]NEB70313.1 hypothetical protein [Streptomyces microflavus]
MTIRWAIEGPRSRDLLTHGGRVIVHGNRRELEWIIAGARIVQCPRSIPPEQTIGLRWLPQFEGVTWPLRREEWRT